MKIASAIFAGVIGGAAGGVAGLFGHGFFDGLQVGFIAGAVVGFLFSLAPRSFEDPTIAIESLSPAGLVGGIAGSVAAEAGWLGAFVSGGVGWVLGVVVPAVLIGAATKRD